MRSFILIMILLSTAFANSAYYEVQSQKEYTLLIVFIGLIVLGAVVYLMTAGKEKEHQEALADMPFQKNLEPEKEKPLQRYKPIERSVRVQKSLKTERIKKPSILPETAGISKRDLAKFSYAQVLVAEDNKINQRILKSLLESSGIGVTVVDNGQEALQEVQKNKELDFILMDTDMPVMDGREATKQIRKLYSQKQLPIVALLSKEGQESIDSMTDAGVNAAMFKPFKLGALYSAFSTCVTKETSKVKNVSLKLSKYIGNSQILDTQKGIAKSMTAIFYKELLQEALVTLNSSDLLIEELISSREDQGLQNFIVSTMRLSEEIEAKGLLKVLKEMNSLFIYKEEYRLSEYTSVYAKAWSKLEEEIRLYLKSSML